MLAHYFDEKILVINNKAMKMSEIVFVKYLFQVDWEPLEDVIEASSKDFGDIYEVDDEKEVIQVAKTSPATLILACVRSKEDLTKVLNFLKLSRKLLKDSNIKVSVLNYLQNKKVENAFMKLGCQEVLDPSLKSKPLKFKMDFWKKALAVGVNKRLQEQNKTVKDTKTEKEAAQKEVPQIKWGESLKVVDDMWITKAPQDTKRILNRWMIKIMGPSPFVAQWVEVDGQKGLWQFVFKDGIREDFQMADGDWFFRGEQKPDFVWKENIWLISGQKFQLFYQEDETVVARFRTHQENLEITKNSNYALSREKIIIESFDQEVMVKKGLADNSKTSVEADQKIADGILREDVDANEKSEGYIKGKNFKESAVEDKEHNVGREDTNLNNLKGDSSTDQLGSSHYAGTVDAKRNSRKNNEIKNARSDSLFDEEGNAATDDVGLQKYKGKLEHGHTERKSQYGGKTETKDLGQSHYSGKTNGSSFVNENHSEEMSDKENETEESIQTVDRVKKVSKVARKSSADVWSDEESETEDERNALDETSKSQKRATQPYKQKPIYDAEEPETEGEKKGEHLSTKRNKTVQTSKDIFDDQDEGAKPIEKIDEKERAAREKGTWSEERVENYSGKSKTDETGSSHYNGRTKGIESVKKNKESDAKSRLQNEDLEGESYEDEQLRPVSKKAVREARQSQGNDDLGKGHYTGKIAKKSSPGIDDSDEAPYDKRSELKNPATISSQERLKEKINARSRSELDDLGGKKEEGSDASYMETVAKTGVKRINKGVVFDDVVEQENSANEDELEGVGESDRLRAAKPPKNVRSEVGTDPNLSSTTNRNKRTQSLDDLLRDGNADDPEEDLLPKGEISNRERLDKKNKTSLEKEEVDDDQDEIRETSVTSKTRNQPNLKLVSNLESPATTDEGEPLVHENAKIKAVLKRNSDPNAEMSIVVDDFFDNIAIVKTLDKQVQFGEMVSLLIVFEYMKKSKTISIKGKCIEAQHDDEESYLSIELDAQDSKIFEQFMRLYELRQSHVADFIKAARGY